MANLLDYLEWRGDISMENDPFNAVDNLVLSWMAYVNLDEVMPVGICNRPVSIKYAVDKFFTIYNLNDKLKEASLTKTSALLFSKLGDCPRFCNMNIVNYVNNISEEHQKQFSAMTIEIDENTRYIAFRGTDDTIIGWREDFNMGLMPCVPSQLDAVDYLSQTAQGGNQRLILGGHSKGGNLAVYAAFKADSGIRKRIIQVYNNDGPGFQKEVLESEEYRRMLPRIKTIVPETSIVGMLLGHEEEYEIVKSSQRGIMQHDAGSWEVRRNSFVYLNSVSNASKFLDYSLKQWIASLDDEHRQIFVDSLFSILDAPGAKTTVELGDMGFKGINSAFKAISNMDPEVKHNLRLILKSLFQIINQNRKATVRKDEFRITGTTTQNNAGRTGDS